VSLKEGFERNPFSANIHQYGDVILSENIFEYLSGNFREQIGLQNPKSSKKTFKKHFKIFVFAGWIHPVSKYLSP